MKLKTISFCLSIVICSNVYANVTDNMDKILKAYIDIVPIVKTEGFVENKSQREFLQKNLEVITNSFKQIGHDNRIKNLSVRPTYDIINEQFQNISKNIASGQVRFIKKQIDSTLNLCMNCHAIMELEGSKISFVNNIDKTYFKSDFDYAEYLFLIRDYLKSIESYKVYITKELNSKKATTVEESVDVMKSFRRILGYHLQVTYDPTKALEFINEYLNKKETPKHIKEELTTWKSDILPWSMIKSLTLENDEHFESFKKRYLSPNEETLEQEAHLMTSLISYGVLSRYLNHNQKSKKTPEILYWLGLSDKNLNQSFFYSLSDLYLKECIEGYPASKSAHKCYDLYEDWIKTGYTGSAGEDLPEEEKKELARLKKLLK